MNESAYQQLLAELEQERENIERMILWLKDRMEQTDSVGTVMTPAKSSVPVRFPRELAPDAFFRKSVPDAIKGYLNIVKRPKTAKDITEGLQQGGLTTKAKNLYATVYPTLLRMEESGEVVRVTKNEWGLTDWYPGARKSNQSPEEKGKTENES
ncbi:MAG TPA: hypothetical protein VMI32_07940 [Candidatus Solibacter sp.]|nr:hypothetical protein [Candidatus Solibacter sp.]